jgi:hypothetical protein
MAGVDLHGSWVPEGLALWAWDGRRAHDGADLRRAASRVLGPSALESGYGGRAVVAFPGGPMPVPTLVLAPDATMAVVADRYPGREWTPSMRWVHAAGTVAATAAARGLVLPELDVAGLEWRVGWVPVADVDLDDAVDALARVMPPVVGAADRAGSGSSSSATTRLVVGALADAACRWALRIDSWRPGLGPSRTAATVALRRLCDGLRTSGAIVGGHARHEAAFATWSAALGDARERAEGGVAASARARLVPPEEPDLPWRLELEVVSTDDPSLVVPWREVLAGGPGADALAAGGSLAPLRRRLGAMATRVARLVPALGALGAVPTPAAVELDTVSVGHLLIGGIDVCERAGLPVLIPAGLVRRRTARVTASATPAETGGPTSGLGRGLVEVDWGLALGDERLGDEELAALAAAKAGIVRVRGEWIRLDAEQVVAALEALARRRRDDARVDTAGLLRLAAEAAAGGGAPGTPDEISAQGWLEPLLAGLPDATLEEVAEPAGFVGALRPYQRRAVGWMTFLGRLGLGGCLADDMGLGKTPTTLAHLAGRAGRGRPSLVVCPLSVVHNWDREAARFTPLLRVGVVHGAERARGDALGGVAAACDVVITTYGTLARDLDGFAAIDWDVVVCDEAQAVKNHHTQAARAVRRLPAAQKLALTGTPVENRLAELWAILDAVNPGMLGGITWFRERFAAPIEQHGDEAALQALRRLTGPFLLRRTKADRSLVPDLPDKVEQRCWATLTREQASLYKAIVDDFVVAAEEETGMRRKGLVLATLTRLKQVCNHPAHYLGDGSRLAGRSGKLARFDELLDELLDAGERALVFTQYREMGELLVRHVDERLGIRAPFLHGGVPKARRDAMVAAFQSGEGPPLQLVSLKAGGTGLNLTAASRVVHYDRWWNPAVENQATDRAWRLGQRRTVFVHTLVCQGTLEERIDALLQDKQKLAGLVVGSGEGWLTELSTEQLRELFRLDPMLAEGRA